VTRDVRTFMLGTVAALMPRLFRLTCKLNPTEFTQIVGDGRRDQTIAS